MSALAFGESQTPPRPSQASRSHHRLEVRYHALACDYDGTLASGGQVQPTTREALIRLRRSGRRIVLVTGREVEELREICPDLGPFDLVVAENGGVLYDPLSHSWRVLGPAPPPLFLHALRVQGVEPLFVGKVIVATHEPYEVAVLRAIHDLGLELQVIFNRGAVMVLPTGVNKATGLSAALAHLKLSPHNVVGVGDGENDHALLSLCQCGVAVANAVPTMQSQADWVTKGEDGTGVAELVDRILEDDLASLAPKLERHDLSVGIDEDGREVRLPAYGTCILIAGSSGGGKSTFAASLLERIEDAGAQYCVIDPEGDYAEHEGAVVIGGVHNPPDADQVLRVLEQLGHNAVINLLALGMRDRQVFLDLLRPRLRALRARTGRPHWLLLDEVHHVLPADRGDTPFATEERSGLIMVTVDPRHVSSSALQAANGIFAIGSSPDETLSHFVQALGEVHPGFPRRRPGAGEAIVWWRRPEQTPFCLRTTRPRVEGRRHRRKYAAGSVDSDKSFYFRGPQGRLRLRAQNLMIFLQEAEGVDDDTWTFHLQRGDYSRWFRDVIRDADLAEAVAEIEHAPQAPEETRRLVRLAVEERYAAPV